MTNSERWATEQWDAEPNLAAKAWSSALFRHNDPLKTVVFFENEDKEGGREDDKRFWQRWCCLKLIIITHSVANNTHSYNLESFLAIIDDFFFPLDLWQNIGFTWYSAPHRAVESSLQRRLRPHILIGRRNTWYAMTNIRQTAENVPQVAAFIIVSASTAHRRQNISHSRGYL